MQCNNSSRPNGNSTTSKVSTHCNLLSFVAVLLAWHLPVTYFSTYMIKVNFRNLIIAICHKTLMFGFFAWHLLQYLMNARCDHSRVFVLLLDPRDVTWSTSGCHFRFSLAWSCFYLCAFVIRTTVSQSQTLLTIAWEMPLMQEAIT